MGASDAAETAEKLFSAGRVVIFTHERPDGDAVGSAFGLRALLRGNGVEADLVFPEPPPVRYREFTGEPDTPTGHYDAAVVLDCATEIRIGKGIYEPRQLADTLFNLDHHGANSIAGDVELIDVKAAATSLLVWEVAAAAGANIPVAAATLLMLGLMTDTGSFRFSNTDARALRAAAGLLDCGAELDRIVNAVYFSKPRNQQLFEAEVVTGCTRLLCGGRLALAGLDESIFKKYGFSMADGEGVIDLLREIDGAVIALLYYRKGEHWKCSLRSKDAAFPVGPLARSLGGGGHEMAAGITLDAPSAAALEAMLVDRIGSMLDSAKKE
ncbi:MAG: bifunctional oligoribonuclease/PAP phosphatase NrnA [Victivallaceae bacterium]|nr:bifunctional oligoribonuclease/PAP phosphatase NrnA [Victivallaceae bacterium]